MYNHIKPLNTDTNSTSNTNNKIVRVLYNHTTIYRANIENYRDELTYPEQKRAAKFHRQTDYNCYICAHYFLRHYYSKVTKTPLHNLELIYHPTEKPKFVNSNIDFNLSHSHDYFALAIAENEDVRVGIDIEVIEPINDFLNIAHSYFHPAEYNYIQELTDLKGCINRFYEVWTRKEAYLKMIGTGLINDIATINTLGKIVEKDHEVAIYTYTNGDIYLSIAVSPDCQIQFADIAED